ncbi:Hypothetical protein PBC10988_15700 [Planctomycetales bacterium 10988]|nr:Hypothetical protein PBC10988_15700 [Planctomycetales bacterium 10988]
MHPALFRLISLRVQGVVRRIFNGLHTVRGLAFLVLGLGVLGVWIAPLLLLQTVDTLIPVDGRSLGDIIPAGLFVACVLTVLLGDDTSIRFQPAEVDFLFSAPIPRRDLITFKLLSHVAGAIVAGSFFFVWLIPYSPMVLSAWIGCIMAFWFLQLFQMTFVLACTTFSTISQGKVRLIIGGVFLGLVSIFLVETWIAQTASGSSWLAATQASWVAYLVLLPFAAFGKILTSERLFPELLGWTLLGVAINLGMTLLIRRLDYYYLEAALSSSQRFYQIIQRAQRGGALSALVTPFSSRTKLPKLPFLGGAGPIAWRQLSAASRSLPTVLGVVGLCLFAIFTPLLLPKADTEVVELAKVAAGAAVLQLTILFTMLLRFDFRGDLHQMDTLKSLPISAYSIVLGELFAPILIASLAQLTLLTGMAMLSDNPMLLLYALWFVIPLNFLFFGLENLLFLLFPVRSVMFNPGDIQGFGHNVVMFAVKMMLLTVCLTIAFLLGGMAYVAFKSNVDVFVGVSWTIITLFALSTLPLIAWAFQRFDPSMDHPT